MRYHIEILSNSYGIWDSYMYEYIFCCIQKWEAACEIHESLMDG